MYLEHGVVGCTRLKMGKRGTGEKTVWELALQKCHITTDLVFSLLTIPGCNVCNS